MTTSPPRRGLLASVGYAFRRTATFLWGPADLREEVDPLVQMDAEQGVERPAPPEPKPTERQQAYDDLPRGTAE